MTSKITIVDYGVGNILSVVRAFEFCGARPFLTRSPQDIINADYLVLPGVGAFGDGIASLKKYNFTDPIKEFMTKQRPFLGICLGMQMMLDLSEEFGSHEGLGIVPGLVKLIPGTTKNGLTHKVPHIGWNKIVLAPGSKWDKTILQGVEEGSSVYFTHSFTANPSDSKHRLADCFYDDSLISAAIHKDQFFGCQFHPEKSGPIGLRILDSFIQF